MSSDESVIRGLLTTLTGRGVIIDQISHSLQGTYVRYRHGVEQKEVHFDPTTEYEHLLGRLEQYTR